jgi:hypothetical protein
VLGQQGRPAESLPHAAEALRLSQANGERLGEARAFNGSGQAISYFNQALTLRRELGDRWGEATTLAHLGDAHLAMGDIGMARDTWLYSVDILDQLGHPDAERIRDKLRDLKNSARSPSGPADQPWGSTTAFS